MIIKPFFMSHNCGSKFLCVNNLKNFYMIDDKKVLSYGCRCEKFALRKDENVTRIAFWATGRNGQQPNQSGINPGLSYMLSHPVKKSTFSVQGVLFFVKKVVFSLHDPRDIWLGHGFGPVCGIGAHFSPVNFCIFSLHEYFFV